MPTREEIDEAYARRDAVYRTAKESECSVCMRQMGVKIANGEPVMACLSDPEHEGYRKLRSLTQLVKDGDAVDPFVSARLERRRQEEMETEIADPEVRALTVYGTERHLMTVDLATKIVAHIWPGAPPDAIARASMLCTQYNLNPLLKHVYIIHYKSKHGPGRDEVVLGIDGYRTIARRRSPFSYKDGPRAMTATEVEATGEDPKATIGAYVLLETPRGAQFPGYGFFSRTDDPLGADKGNTRFNMACKRAETAALRRVMPDEELPAPVDIDAPYADISEYAATAPPSAHVDTETGEITGDLGLCPVHNKAFKFGQYGPYCGTKLRDGSWCKEKPRANGTAKKVTGEILDPPARSQGRPQDAASPVSSETNLDEEFPPVVTTYRPAKGPHLNLDDWAAMDAMAQANAIIPLAKRHKEAYDAVREGLGIPKTTAGSMTAEQRLAVMQALVDAGG